jgi:two-component sensor histidine kinase
MKPGVSDIQRLCLSGMMRRSWPAIRKEFHLTDYVLGRQDKRKVHYPQTILDVVGVGLVDGKMTPIICVEVKTSGFFNLESMDWMLQMIKGHIPYVYVYNGLWYKIFLSDYDSHAFIIKELPTYKRALKESKKFFLDRQLSPSGVKTNFLIPAKKNSANNTIKTIVENILIKHPLVNQSEKKNNLIFVNNIACHDFGLNEYPIKKCTTSRDTSFLLTGFPFKNVNFLFNNYLYNPHIKPPGNTESLRKHNLIIYLDPLIDRTKSKKFILKEASLLRKISSKAFQSIESDSTEMFLFSEIQKYLSAPEPAISTSLLIFKLLLLLRKGGRLFYLLPSRYNETPIDKIISSILVRKQNLGAIFEDDKEEYDLIELMNSKVKTIEVNEQDDDQLLSSMFFDDEKKKSHKAIKQPRLEKAVSERLTLPPVITYKSITYKSSTCEICGKSSYETPDEFLGSGSNHLECELAGAKEGKEKKEQTNRNLTHWVKDVISNVASDIYICKSNVKKIKDELEKDGLKRVDKLNNYISRIDKKLNRAEEIITGFDSDIIHYLDHSSLQDPELKSINLKSIINSAIEAFNFETKKEEYFKHFNIDSSSIPDNLNIYVDDTQFRSIVLLQAMINSIKHAFDDDHKVITLKIKATPDYQFDNNQFIMIELTDNGKGMPDEENPDNLFLPFSKKTQSRPGRGLPLLKESVINHGGKVFISAEDGFKITILIPQTNKGST